MYSSRPCGWWVAVSSSPEHSSVSDDELTVQLRPQTDLRKPVAWANICNRRYTCRSSCEVWFESIDEDCEGVVAVAYAKTSLVGEWPLDGLFLKGMRPESEVAIVALASNGYKFNGLECVPGGKSGFRAKAMVQVNTDFSTRIIEMMVRQSTDSPWTAAATFRLPANVSQCEYMVLVGVKGWVPGPEHAGVACTASLVRLLRMETSAQQESH
eukprot:TRINITY_DN11513_c0_g1_i1.p1 TRINITY_DN11513_c0_g1~~TRINITY_DN11513_c0_g1_i1.p1  ORF type:complete len:212 (-),score=17.58 TRINITY_DN11513_c0_g1_i1:135-770(-)